MIKIDGITLKKRRVFQIFDYLWSGFLTLGVMSVFLAFWELGSVYFGEFILPSPEAVLKKALEILLNFRENDLDITLYRAFIGVFVACFLGIVLGFLAGYFKSFFMFFKPIAIAFLTMPPIIWIVLALFWFGFGDKSTIFTIIVVVFPYTFFSASMAMSSVSVANSEMFKAYNLGILKTIRYLYAPHLLSYLISALEVAISSGVKVVVMAELLGANDGIGAMIFDAKSVLDTTSVLAYVVIIIAFVGLVNYLLIKPLEIVFVRRSGA